MLTDDTGGYYDEGFVPGGAGMMGPGMGPGGRPGASVVTQPTCGDPWAEGDGEEYPIDDLRDV